MKIKLIILFLSIFFVYVTPTYSQNEEPSGYDFILKPELYGSDALFARLSSQRFIDNNDEIPWRNVDIDKLNMYRWAEHNHFTPNELHILRESMIPDENKNNIRTNFQTSGFFLNTFESIGNVYLSIYDALQNKEYKLNKFINKKIGSESDIGDYKPFLDEIHRLETKLRNAPIYSGLSKFETERLGIMKASTNLLNSSQKFKSVIGTNIGFALGWLSILFLIIKVFKIIINFIKRKYLSK